jgi:type I restriction enzyme, R subunit
MAAKQKKTPWIQGWDVTPEDQRVKFVTLSKNLTTHPDFKSKVADNGDSQNSHLAFVKILDDVMAKQRKTELDLYRLYAQDSAFKQAFADTMKRMAGV